MGVDLAGDTVGGPAGVCDGALRNESLVLVNA